MALQPLTTPVVWPGINIKQSGVISIATDTTVDAAGEYQAIIFQAREAMTISHVAFRTGAVSGSPTADVRIETVGADGLPTGTLWATNTNIVTATLVLNTTALHALTASASITAGQVFCVKIAFNSGTSFIIQNVANINEEVFNLPYQVVNTGTPAKTRILLGTKILALGSSTSTFYNMLSCMAATTAVNSTFNNTSSAARGLRFQVPFTGRCVGIRMYQSASVGDYAYVLYNDAGTELSSSSTAIEGDQSGASSSSFNDLYFDNPVTLSPATWYRVAIEPNSATSCGITTITLLSTDYLSTTPFGATGHYTTRASGTWDDSTTTQIPIMDILIDQLDDGTGGGGSGGQNRALLHSGVSAVG